MPYSKDPTTYPPEFAKLFDRAQREQFELDVGDYGEAQSLRHRLHAFRRAVEGAKLPGYALMRNIVLKVRGTRVVFSNQNEILKAVRAAAGVEAPTEAALAAYENLAFEGDTNVRPVREAPSREQGVPSEEKEQVQNWQDLFGIEKEESQSD